MLDCLDIMDVTRSRDLKIWLPDGLNYPGARRPARPPAATRRLVAAGVRTPQRRSALVLEYKLFEPAFYATDVPDWGTAYAHCAALGERAVVCFGRRERGSNAGSPSTR